jgi:hypothetical protein
MFLNDLSLYRVCNEFASSVHCGCRILPQNTSIIDEDGDIPKGIESSFYYSSAVGYRGCIGDCLASGYSDAINIARNRNRAGPHLS